MKKLTKGFTLIELLVVVTIVGILAAIIIVSLSSARNKGGDAGVKSNLNTARSQAEVFFNNNTAANLTYTGVCTNGAVGGIQGVGLAVLTAAKAVGLANYTHDAVGTSAIAVCNDSPGAWAAQVPLKQGGFWCVDSTNKSLQSATNLITTTTDYTCS